MAKNSNAAVLQPPVAGFSWDAATDLSRRDAQDRLSGAAVAAFFRLAEHWKLRDEDARLLLGGVSSGWYYQLKAIQGKSRSSSAARKTFGRRLDQDKLTRVSLLLGIYKALHILYSERLADAWVQLENRNPLFQGEAPLAYMVKGGVPGMVNVRRLLDARRGGR
jgi:Antitoxin Xre/MbcA/ParS C-terminal toxin-binding domain